ncbi:MAG: hypothetical protein WC879_00885 [Melioribacteraceae bacterium]
MKLPWFNRMGILFYPRNIIGWLILLAAIVLSVYEFIDIDSRSHSVSDTLINWVFNCFLIALVYSGIAFFTCKRYGDR